MSCQGLIVRLARAFQRLPAGLRLPHGLPAMLLTLLLVVCVPPATAGHAIELSEVEKSYLQTLGEVRFCVDPDWLPFEHVDAQGNYTGIAADLLALVSERIGVPFRLLPTRNWDETMEASRRGRCHFVSFLNRSPKREQWLMFTRPIFSDSNVLITREDHPLITDLGSFPGETMALPQGTSIEEWVRADFPQIRIVNTVTEAEALELVTRREVDMTMRSLTVSAYTIKNEGWFNLKIAGLIPNYENHLRIGVGKAFRILRDILDRGVESITPQERNQIVDRHVSIKMVNGIDYSLVYKLLILMTVIVLTSLFWIGKLRKVNAQLKALSTTDALTGLSNRTSVDQAMRDECARAQRFSRQLSLFIVDVDHFKAINDEAGHLVGDRVLVEVADIVRRETRAVDRVFRWGGEEFLVICPETEAAQALLIAERIVYKTREGKFSVSRPVTVSIGVAALDIDDQPLSLFSRADKALYEAKRSGRNRVVFGN